jgi:hypothetical protein
MVDVVSPALEGGDELAGDQKGGIAGVVMDVPQPFFFDFLAREAKQLGMIAILVQNVGNQT